MKLSLTIIVQDSESGKGNEISELVEKVSIFTSILGEPGRLNIDMLLTSEIVFNIGSLIYIETQSGIKLFFGVLFQIKEDNNGKVSLVFYDQTRYLKNSETYLFNDMTTSGIFEKICKDFNIKYKIGTPSNHIVKSSIHENKTLYDIMEYALMEDLRNTGTKYIIRDNFGVLEFVDIKTLHTNLVLGDGSLVSQIKYCEDIDNNSYTEISLIAEDKNAKKRSSWREPTKESEEIYRKNRTLWGSLRYTQSIDLAEVNTAQLAEQAKVMLEHYSRVRKSLTISGIDTPDTISLKAGDGFIFNGSLPSGRIIKASTYIVSSKHSISDGKSEFSFEIMVD